MSKETDAVKCALALAMVDYVWMKGLLSDEERIKAKVQLLKEYDEKREDDNEKK